MSTGLFESMFSRATDHSECDILLPDGKSVNVSDLMILARSKIKVTVTGTREVPTAITVGKSYEVLDLKISEASGHHALEVEIEDDNGLVYKHRVDRFVKELPIQLDVEHIEKNVKRLEDTAMSKCVQKLDAMILAYNQVEKFQPGDLVEWKDDLRGLGMGEGSLARVVAYPLTGDMLERAKILIDAGLRQGVQFFNYDIMLATTDKYAELIFFFAEAARLTKVEEPSITDTDV